MVENWEPGLGKIRIEVTGKRALYTPRELRMEPRSYDVPPASVGKGIMDCIYMHPGQFKWVCDWVHVLNPVRHETLVRNGVKTLAKLPSTSAVKSGGAGKVIDVEKAHTQIMVQHLVDVRYVFGMHIEMNPDCPIDPDRNNLMKHDSRTRRFLRNGLYGGRRSPHLGVSEFTCNVRLLGNVEEEPVGVYDEIPEIGFGWMHYGMDWDTADKINAANPKAHKQPDQIIGNYVMRNGFIDFMTMEKTVRLEGGGSRDV